MRVVLRVALAVVLSLGVACGGNSADPASSAEAVELARQFADMLTGDDWREAQGLLSETFMDAEERLADLHRELEPFDVRVVGPPEWVEATEVLPGEFHVPFGPSRPGATLPEGYISVGVAYEAGA